MAAKVGEEVSVYAGCPDISLTVTPDIKHAGRSSLVFVDLSGGHARLGGSALAQTFKQLGDVAPDCDTALLVPSADTPRVQECHITMGHIICDCVERAMFAKP